VFDVRDAADRWWLVDPEGRPFLTVGFAPVRLGDRIGVERAATVLSETGVNTLGCWSDWRAFRQLDDPLPYTRFLGLARGYRSRIADRYGAPDERFDPDRGASVSLFDPYEDDFEEHCHEAAATLAETADDPYLVGIYADNEYPFYPGLLESYVDLPVGDPGRDAADKWLAERGLTPQQITDADRTAFQRFMLEAYYSTVHEAVREYDDEHLFFGNRLFGYDLGLLRANDRPHFEVAGEYVDVLAVNLYDMWTADQRLVRKWSEWADAPFHVTEFYAKGMDSGMSNRSGAGWVVETQEDRGKYYQNTALSLLQSGCCVGWHWHTFRDRYEDGGLPQPHWANKGLIDPEGDPRPDLQSAMARLNDRLYGLADRLSEAKRR
jgi:hypothetical protein